MMNNSIIIIKFRGIIEDFDGYEQECIWSIQASPLAIVKDLLIRFYQISGLDEKNYKTDLNKKKDKLFLTLKQAGLYNNIEILISKNDEQLNSSRSDEALLVKNKPINDYKIFIKFIRCNEVPQFEFNKDLNGLLKLCLLNEISSKFNENDIERLKSLSPDIYFIMKILNQSNTCKSDNPKKIIRTVLKQKNGSNVINFSNFVDMVVNNQNVNQLMNCLNKRDLNVIIDIKKRLGKYIEYITKFDQEFYETLRQSIFEFSVVSLVVIERPDFDKFKKASNKCSNRKDRILYHGTQIHKLSNILTDLFNRSIGRCCQHGEGVYFTDNLDYCWFYGGASGNRANVNKIPRIGKTFTAIASFVYYDSTKFLKVLNYVTRKRPEKNAINFAYASSDLETINIPYANKFHGTEYVVWELEQICPLISLKFERVEYCIIWRDDDFSKEAIYNNEFDKIFKNFLKDGIKYIKQNSRFNIYPCKTTKEAIDLIKRKKYNKIILMSNAGKNLIGRDFINEARKIIGNDVIALFVAYREEHLKWIKNYKNGLFCNELDLFQEYIDCFNDPKPENKILDFIKKSENHYKIKFNINYNFLQFPLYRDSGFYSNLTL